MTRLALAAVIVSLAFAASALAGPYAVISADWSDSARVHVSVLSNHQFHGTVENACVATDPLRNTDETRPLDNWVYNAIAHQFEAANDFDITQAGSSARCTI